MLNTVLNNHRHCICLKKLKDEFVKELMAKYGETALSKLKKETKEEKT